MNSSAALGPVVSTVPIYLAPTIAAYRNGVSQLFKIFLINAFLGWSIVGWGYALSLALKDVPLNEKRVACDACRKSSKQKSKYCFHCAYYLR